MLRKFQARWDVMLYVPMNDSLGADVEVTAWKLTRAGQNLPLTDIVIGCCARRIGAVVLTHDKHFSVIPGVKAASEIWYRRGGRAQHGLGKLVRFAL